MAPFYFILALLIQSSICYADNAKGNKTESIEVVAEVDENQKDGKISETFDDIASNSIEEIIIGASNSTSSQSEIQDVLLSEFRGATNNWVDMFLGSNSELSPSTATSAMVQAMTSNKSPEEQMEEIKEVTSEITKALQSEMTNLLSRTLDFGDTDGEDTKLRKRRSTETPMDSSKLVLSLLNHIKSFNEHQNIAIEKMMSAQEIADKYGVEFNPDPDILFDLAVAANEQAKELTSVLEEVCNTKNSSCTPIISAGLNETCTPLNTTYYVFSSDYPDSENISISQGHEHNFQPMWDTNHHHHGDHAGYDYYNYHIDNQIPPPPVQHSYGCPVTPNPTFYDSISYNPDEYYAPYCSVDPMGLYPFYSFDDPLYLEPELVGEEYEETVSSKLVIEQDEEPGSATVNHVMTYTVSEKAHFRTPQIEKLPQQVQYYFLLM